MRSVKTKVAIGVILLIVILFNVFRQISINNAYNRALDLIEDGRYKEAAAEFCNVDSRFEKASKYRVEDGEYYKDSAVLYFYAKARYDYDNDPSTSRISKIHSRWKEFPTNYQGAFCDEIYAYKADLDKEYEAYSEENERLWAEYREKELKKIKNGIPYVGMSDEYMEQTLLGEYDKYEWHKTEKKGRTCWVDEYYWYSDTGGYVAFYVKCENGVVVETSKGLYEEYLWTPDGKPNFGGEVKGLFEDLEFDDDSYDVDSFWDPEDFYEEYYDDFWDYEEAEDYYYSHRD